MPSFHSRATRGALALAAVAALGACTDIDQPAPTQPFPNLAPTLATGDVYTVTNTNDNGLGSLRWAMGFVTGGEIIRFDPALAGQTITVDSALTSEKPMTIEGPAGRGITIRGSGQSRVFELNHTLVTTLRNLSVTNGRAPAHSGGGIYATGNLVLENVTVHGNVADGPGGILSRNIRVVNSTISGNTSNAGYSALLSDAKIELVNTTIAHNSSGGISSSDGVVILRNSIIANNGSDRNCKITYATKQYEGTNLSNDDSCGGPADMMIGEPQLAPLADNGGPGMTHALIVGSPAIGAGASCSVATDQRYVPRDAECDLGAFEFIDLTTVTLGIDAGASVNPTTGWAVVTGTVQCSRDETFDVEVELEQESKSGRTTSVAQASGRTPVACGTTPRPWSVALAPSSGSFQIGNAAVVARTADAEKWVTPAAGSATVKLYRARK